jgi:nucleotide-binding universal stress UspA family protein
MVMKDAVLYLLPIGTSASEAALAYAAAFAKHLDAEVTAITFAFDVVHPISLYAPNLDDTQTREARAENDEIATTALTKAKAAFNCADARFIGVKETCLPIEAMDLLVAYARLRDVAILPSGRDKTPMERELIEEVLFESGRPVLLVPQDGKSAYGIDRVMVAWDYSRTAVRAVADALPLLARAKKVHIVTVADDKEMTMRLGAVEFARHLAHHGIDVLLEQVLREEADIGAALFQHAAAVNADLLVMGGYGHSRMREFILGGATHSVLTSAPLPVLMSH